MQVITRECVCVVAVLGVSFVQGGYCGTWVGDMHSKWASRVKSTLFASLTRAPAPHVLLRIREEATGDDPMMMMTIFPSRINHTRYNLS